MNIRKLITLAAVAASAAILPMTSNAKTVYWRANAGGDIIADANWNTESDGSGTDGVSAAGDYLDFSKITTTGYTLSGSFDNDRIFAGAKFALEGDYSVTMTGSLHFQSLLNANHLAVASTGSLTVEDNLTWDVSTAKNENNMGRLLYRVDNGGTVVVKGLALGHSGYGGNKRSGCRGSLRDWRGVVATANPPAPNGKP